MCSSYSSILTCVCVGVRACVCVRAYVCVCTYVCAVSEPAVADRVDLHDVLLCRGVDRAVHAGAHWHGPRTRRRPLAAARTSDHHPRGLLVHLWLPAAGQHGLLALHHSRFISHSHRR